MAKVILKVFLIIALITAVLLWWDLTFNDGGITETVYNAVTDPVNEVYQKIMGNPNAKFFPEFRKKGDALGDYL